MALESITALLGPPDQSSRATREQSASLSLAVLASTQVRAHAHVHAHIDTPYMPTIHTLPFW